MSENQDLELLKALYDFTATDPKTLSFKASDQFVNLEKHANTRKWWRVIDKNGHIGCIPCNYVSTVEESSDNILNFLDACTGCLQDSLSRGTVKPSSCLDKTLTELAERRQRVSGVFRSGKGPAPRAPPEGAPAQPNVDSEPEVTKCSGDISANNTLEELPSTEAAYGLIQQVRRCTNLSYDLSREAVRMVLSGLGQLPAGLVAAPAGLVEVAAAKDDDQQRSWMLHEDEQTLSEYLIELQSILCDADSKVCVRVMESTEWEGVMALLQFYQMECRWSIRQLLLKALSAITGQPMPVTHLEQLGVEFATFLFNNIEQPPECDSLEQLPDVFLRLLFSLNLQFRDPNENVLLQALAKCTVAQAFTEKSLLLFNREEDPVQRFCTMTAENHSVLKLFIDLFSGSTTAQLFYTNDTKVLVDIIARQLADLSPGDEHCHRKEDLRSCLQQITAEEGAVSQADQALVQSIIEEFPAIF
ncbi:hypothetical protein B566_EDAN003493, partial [Ephemera danica]